MIRRALLMSLDNTEPVEFQGLNVIPKAWKDEETISDGWSKIVASCQDGTYLSKYHLGDTKIADFGIQGLCMMQIVAFDKDNLEDGSGKAPITWGSQHVLYSPQKGRTEHNYLLNYLPIGLKNAIRSVKKDYRVESASSNRTESRAYTLFSYGYGDDSKYTNFPLTPRITGLTPYGPKAYAQTRDYMSANNLYLRLYGSIELAGSTYSISNDAAGDYNVKIGWLHHVAPCFCT